MIRLRKYVNEGKLKAYLLTNVLINEDAIKSNNTPALRQFLVDSGIDYQMVSNAFGWGEKMLVLYNMKKIAKIQRVDPKADVIGMLPLEWK